MNSIFEYPTIIEQHTNIEFAGEIAVGHTFLLHGVLCQRVAMPGRPEKEDYVFYVSIYNGDVNSCKSTAEVEPVNIEITFRKF